VELPTFPTTTAPPENSVAEIVRKWERMSLKSTLMCGQCTEVIRVQIDAHPGIENVSNEANYLKLLVMFKDESDTFSHRRSQ